MSTTFLEHVGYVLFPRRPADLTDTTRCPACFEPLTGTVCANCRLDVSHPAAAELATVAADTAALLERRLELIGRIRYETAPVPEPAPAPPMAAPVVPVEPPATRRHLGVQVVLLIVGISLLSIGAIFFLVYAFVTFGLVWRSVIIAAVTVAAFAGATLLRRRRLGASAEAIAALAVVLVYLDAFAIRANDLFGAGGADALVYWGAALLVSSAILLAWHRLAGLRVASVVAFVAAVPGLALLVAGVTGSLDPAQRVFAGFAAAAVGALAHLATRAALERSLTLVLGLLGLLGAAGAAFFIEPRVEWAPVAGLLLVAGIAIAHAIVLARLRVATAVAAVFAGIAGAVASLAGWAAALRVLDPAWATAIPILSAAVVALVAESVARRVDARPARAAAWTAAAVGGLIAVPVVLVVLVTAARVAAGSEVWSSPGAASLQLDPGETASIVSLIGVLGLTALAWGLHGLLLHRRVALAWIGSLLLVLAVPLTGMLWAAVTGWLVLALVAAVVLVRGLPRSLRLVAAVAGGLSLVLGYAASWSSLDTWWIGSLGTVAVLVVARWAVARPVLRAALLGVATVVALVAAGAAAWRGNEAVAAGAGRELEAAHGVLALSAVLLIAAAVARAQGFDGKVLFWVPATAAAFTAIASWLGTTGEVAPPLVVAEPLASTVLAGALLLGLVLSASAAEIRNRASEDMPRLQKSGAEAVVAGVAVAPVAAWALVSAARLAGLDESLAPVLAAALVAAVTLATRRQPRWAWDAGALLVTVATVATAMITTSDASWLVLLIAAVALLLIAVSPDGLFGSVSARKHAGWAALAAGTAGLWTRLLDDGMPQLEAYVLPVAGTLLLVALLTWRAARPQPSTVAPFVLLAGLLVGVLPIAADALDGDVVRTVIVVAVSAVLLLVGSFASGAAQRYLDAAALAGALGVLVGAIGRAWFHVVRGEGDNLAVDAWLAAGLAVLLLAAIGQSRRAEPLRAVTGQVLVGVALAGVAVVELGAAQVDGLGSARLFSVVTLLAAVQLVAFVLDRPPLTRTLGWVTVGLAALVAVLGVSRGILDPAEWATVPIALGLLVSGAWRLRQDATAGSWAWLAPGILVLLVPSLVQTFVDDALWRLVALAIACVALIVLGALGGLQAPLILGSVIVLVHGVRTFAPQLVAVYEATQWWVWAVVGGAIILFLGFTIERRIRDLRSVAARVSALR